MPMLELLYRASSVHRMFFDPTEVQQCTLLSIKTGGCTEDCGYCSQSVRHKTFVKPTPQMKVNTRWQSERHELRVAVHVLQTASCSFVPTKEGA